MAEKVTFAVVNHRDLGDVTAASQSLVPVIQIESSGDSQTCLCGVKMRKHSGVFY